MRDGAPRRWRVRLEGAMNDRATFPNGPDQGLFYIDADRLVARFPNVHADAETELHFQRTLRVPDDGQHYPLPTGLGLFPLRHLEDFETGLPRSWRDRGGIVMPMWRG